MNLFTDSFEAIALHDEFQWLQQCLDASERGRKQLIGTVKEHQRRIAQLEAAAENAAQVAAAQAERQWKALLQQKESEWMHEYDAQVQSLLRIIRHHERTHKLMDKELRDARSAAREKASSSTQTEEVAVFCGDDQQLQLPSGSSVVYDASTCRLCGLECVSLPAEANGDTASESFRPPEVVQVRALCGNLPRGVLVNELVLWLALAPATSSFYKL